MGNATLTNNLGQVLLPEAFSVLLKEHHKIHLTGVNLVYVEADLPSSPAPHFPCPGGEPTAFLMSSE